MSVVLTPTTTPCLECALATHHTLSPHGPVVTYATTYSLHGAIINQRDQVGHAVLPANGHAADQSASVLFPSSSR